jgi:hypothetical protein
MIKLNDTATASINVLAEGELDLVVGGYCHRGRRGWGYGGGRHEKNYDRGCGRRDYDKGYDEPSDDSYSADSSGDSVEVNNQVIQLEITINQVAG